MTLSEFQQLIVEIISVAVLFGFFAGLIIGLFGKK